MKLLAPWAIRSDRAHREAKVLPMPSRATTRLVNARVWSHRKAGIIRLFVHRHLVVILVLEALPISEIQVALMAAAMDTGCLILLLAKSTDKMFQPQISIIIEQADWEAGRRLRSKRYGLIGTACVIFLLTIFLFGKPILGLYGEKFIGAYPALCFVSVGTSVWTLFSLAPAFLHFRGKSVFVLTVTSISTFAILLLTTWLGLSYGATGAGAAFCIVMVCTAGTFLVHASKDFTSLKRP